MGLADALIALGIPYDSEAALAFGKRAMTVVEAAAVARSVELGKERGSFPHFHSSRWQRRGCPTMRNATVTSVAPTGTISLLAGASSGIEPLFGLAYVRHALDGTGLPELHPAFERAGHDRGFLNDAVLAEVVRTGSVRGLPAVPEDVQRRFATALDTDPTWHVRMQAAFQEHTDNAVSKTVNLPHDAPAAEVDRLYRLACRLWCKGITVYRYGSRREQVLTPGEETPAGDDTGGQCGCGPDPRCP
jgi:ribonucleoside-diphosphate reductase alpha chain